MAKSVDIDALAGALLEESWTADEQLDGVSAGDRDKLVAVFAAKLADNKSRSEDLDNIPGLLDEIGTAKAKALIVTLVDHASHSVAKGAIECLPDDKTTLALLLPRVDKIAARGDDLALLAVVEKLIEIAPTNAAVIAALASHWNFAVINDGTLMASNAIFDALIEHAPSSPIAHNAFANAAASPSEYAQIRGHAALALTAAAPGPHLDALLAVKATQISSKSLRKNATKLLATSRKAELVKLKTAGNKAAGKILSGKA